MYKQVLNASSRPSCNSMRSWFSYSTFAAKDFTLQPFALPGFAAIIHQAKSGCHHMSPGRWWEVLPKGELWWPSTISPMLTPLVLKLTDSAWFNNLLSAAFEAKIATLDRQDQLRIPQFSSNALWGIHSETISKLDALAASEASECRHATMIKAFKRILGCRWIANCSSSSA